MPNVKGRHVTVFREQHRYVLGPSVAIAANGDWLVAFNMATRREVGRYSPKPWLHPPSDPDYRNYLARSTDGGESWDYPRVLPGYDWHGLEHAGLCVLRNGDLLASHYRRQFHALETAEKLDLAGAVHQSPYPWVVAHEGTHVHRSRDHGLTWGETVRVDTAPYISGYSPREAVELADGRLLMPLAAADPFYDVYFEEMHHEGHRVMGGHQPPPLGNERDADGNIAPGKSAAFVAISTDGGSSWRRTLECARDPQVNFYEPALVRLREGRLICHLRTEDSDAGGGYLYQVSSDDDGATWSPVRRLPIWGSPAHLVQLADGRVLSVYGHRREPFGIRGCLSADGGESWDIPGELVIRDDLVQRVIGYPTSIVLDDGHVFTVYWDEDAVGVTSIVGTFYMP